jgi:hypothetical protein
MREYDDEDDDAWLKVETHTGAAWWFKATINSFVITT